MIERDIRNKILNRYSDKEEKIFVSNLIGLINKFLINDYIVHTKFLNLNEKSIAISILKYLNVNYKIYENNEYSEKVVIFLIPEYLKNEEIYSNYITCLKVIPSVKNKLLHKDYMGSIYSLGITDENIGDIFLKDSNAYFFIFNENLDYFKYNLSYVGRISVKLEFIDINKDEIKDLKIDYNSININVLSLRVDIILAEIYNLSRNEVKNKIENGDLFINSKQVYFIAENVKENDIISFKRCGKIKVGNIIGNTRSGKIILNVKKYI